MTASDSRNNFYPGEFEQFEQEVLAGWQALSEQQARRTIRRMIETPSVHWLKLVNRAHDHDIKHWQLIIENESPLRSSIATAMSAQSGLVDPT